MSSKFRKVKLCEILSFKTGKLDSNAAVDNGCYPFFTCSPVTLSINTHAFDTEAVLLAGNNANGVFSVKYHNGKFNAYQRTYVITPLDNSAVNVKWLYFRIKYVTSELQSMSVGTATKFLTKKILDSFEIELPTFEEQTYQAQILWALQDKLANHEAINQTLEQMAQALFKSWFVDFEPVKAKMAALEAGGSQEDATRAAMTAISGKEVDALAFFEREHPEQYAELKATAELFPSAMQESEQGEIPAGWDIKNIKSLCHALSKGTTPAKKDLDPEENQSVNFLKVKDIGDDGWINLFNLDKISKRIHEVVLKRSILQSNDILFSIAGTIGRVAVVTNEMRDCNCNQAIAFMRLKEKASHLNFIRLNLQSKKIQQKVESKIVQGGQANVSLAALGELEVILPSNGVLKAFNKIITPLWEQQVLITKSNQ